MARTGQGARRLKPAEARTHDYHAREGRFQCRESHPQRTRGVDSPNPVCARMLQQSLGGIKGEIRIMMQCLLQAWNCPGALKFKGHGGGR